MASSSSIQSSGRRLAPFVPLVSCPDCGLEVQQHRSGTSQHEGWIYYSCRTHRRGCDFWHWELQYVMYLMEKEYLVGYRAAGTFAWAEERRERLELKKKQSEARGQEHEERMMKSIGSVGEQLTEAVLLLKLVVVLMVVGCLLLVQNK